MDSQNIGEHSMSVHYDAIVIGSGVIGTAIVLALAKRQWQVAAVDKLPTCGYAATAASSSILHPFYTHQANAAVAFEAHHYFANWAAFIGEQVDELGLADYIDCGALVFSEKNDQHSARACMLMEQLGIPYQSLDGEIIRRDFPHLFADAHTQALFLPTAGYIEKALLATHNMMRAAQKSGADFLFGHGVNTIRKTAGRVSGVTLDDGTVLHSAVVINAGGASSSQINRMADVTADMQISTRALRREMSNTAAPNHRLRQVVIDYQNNIYMRTQKDGQLVIGTNGPGLSDETRVDPEAFNPYFTDICKTYTERLQQRIPTLKVPTECRGAIELCDASSDWNPVYDASALPGFYMAIGTSGHQFKSAPVVGELISELIENTENGNNQDTNPLRFKLRHTGNIIDTGVYSRLREVTESLPKVSMLV